MAVKAVQGGTGRVRTGVRSTGTGGGPTTAPYLLTAALGTAAATGIAAALIKLSVLVAVQGAATASGQAANLTYVPTPGVYTLTADTGFAVGTGDPAALAFTAISEQGAATASGQDVALVKSSVLTAAQGAATATGIAANLTYVPVSSGPTAIAFQTSATAHSASSASGTITCPTVVAGDIIVMMDFCESATTANLVVPTGFTSIASTSNTATRGMITTYKIADGTESGTTITSSTSGNTKTEKILATFRPSGGTVTTVTVGSLHSQFPLSTTPTSQTCAATGGTAPLVVVGCFGATVAVSGRSFSPAATAEITESFNYFLYLDHKSYNSAPADHTISSTTNATAMHSFYLAVS